MVTGTGKETRPGPVVDDRYDLNFPITIAWLVPTEVIWEVVLSGAAILLQSGLRF